MINFVSYALTFNPTSGERLCQSAPIEQNDEMFNMGYGLAQEKSCPERLAMSKTGKAGALKILGFKAHCFGR